MTHSPPMTSINKCNGSQEEKDEILKKWMDDYYKMFPEKGKEDFCMAYKLDGIALSIEYEKGLLVRAGLRSKNGVDGSNVTEKMKYIQNIPQKLPLPLTLTIRGEIETHKKDFDIICKELENSGEEVKSNPRAYTAGCMGRKYAEEIKDARLQFTAYSILNFKNPPYKTEIERAKWAEENLGIKFVKLIPFSYAYLKSFEEIHKKLDFMVDGCVISVNNLEKQNEMGTYGNSVKANPKGKIAFKFSDEEKIITVEKIEFQVGRTGAITPVLCFKGVELESTIVQKCTAHNIGNLINNKIGIGSRISIIKSGKIIPKIKSIIEAKGKVEYPLTCPTCGEKTTLKKGGTDTTSLVCTNKFCSAKKIQTLNHYLSVTGCKGISDSILTKLTETNLISDISDLYRLKLQDLLNIGFKERTAVLILARIAMINNPEQEKENYKLLQLLQNKNKINIKFETFFSSLGIDGAGKEAGRILSEKYTKIEEIFNLTEEEILQLDGIGPITAKNICEYFKVNKKQIEDLLNYVNIDIKVNTGILKGKTFCLSGNLEGGKDKWKEIIEKNGGNIKSGVSKKIDYLLAAEGSGLKTEQAIKYNVKIITEEDLENMIK
jgi:DNA ligase (NAD+)